MFEEQEAQSTLRDTLTSQVEALEQQEVQEVSPQEQQQAIDRARDERGRFAPSQQQPQEVAQPVERQRPQRPSSWKKEYWDHWDKLDPSLADYLLQRENEYKTGVSTYKSEADNARQLREAMAPFMPILQQSNLAPEQWIRDLGRVHYTLSTGSEQEKRDMLQQLARSFNVSLDGQPQAEISPELAQLRAQVSQLTGNWNSFQKMQEQSQQEAAHREITSFQDGKEHFEAVREQMAGLLRSGFATDLQSAYDMACRLNDEVWNSIQEKKRFEEANKQHVQRAKASAVQVRTSTPGGVAQNGGPKGLREQLSEAFEGVGGGRI